MKEEHKKEYQIDCDECKNRYPERSNNDLCDYLCDCNEASTNPYIDTPISESEKECQNCKNSTGGFCPVCCTAKNYTGKLTFNNGYNIYHSDKTWEEDLKQVIRESSAERIDRNSIFNHVKPFIESLLTSTTIKAKEDIIQKFRQFRFYSPEYMKVVDDILTNLEEPNK